VIVVSWGLILDSKGRTIFPALKFPLLVVNPFKTKSCWQLKFISYVAGN